MSNLAGSRDLHTAATALLDAWDGDRTTVAAAIGDLRRAVAGPEMPTLAVGQIWVSKGRGTREIVKLGERTPKSIKYRTERGQLRFAFHSDWLIWMRKMEARVG